VSSPAASDGSGLDVDISDSFDSQTGKQAAPGKPAATVMFDQGSPMAAGLGMMEPSASSNASTTSEDHETDSSDDEESGPRPAKTKSKGRPVVKKGQRRSPGPAKWGSMGADEETDAKAPQSSSKKGIILAAVAALVIILAAVAVFALRGGKKPQETSTVETPKPAELAPTRAEPAANEEPPALAAKPAPALAKPAESPKPAAAQKVVAEKPSSAEKAGHAEKTAAEKPSHAEKPGHAEKAAHEEKSPAEKGKPVASDSTPPPAEPKSGGSPSESDYQRANDAYQRGNEKLFKGNTADAIKDFNQALKLNPKDPAIHRGLGLAYAQSGNSPEAVKHLKAYLKAAPKANDRAMVEKRIDQLREK
jgi:hypothetical protein